MGHPEGRRSGARRRCSLIAATFAATASAVALALTSPAHAVRIFPAVPIDLDNGRSSVQLGSTIGDREAWFAFAQEAGGVQRMLIRYTRNGRYRGVAQFVDNGNPITGGGLVGDRHGEALAIWGEQVGGKGVVFARRLIGGGGGPAFRVTPPGSDVDFANLMNPYDRSRDFVMSRTGIAAFCYRDATNASFVAILPAGSTNWTRHRIAHGCFDLGIDDRGYVVSLGSDGAAIFADKVIRGQVASERITSDVMDQTTLAVGFGGAAIVVGRDDTMDIFARRQQDIARNTSWPRAGGNLEDGILIDDGRSPEDPFAAMGAGGDGAVVFRDNAMNGSFGYYRLLNATTPGRGGRLFSQSIGRSGRVRVAVDRLSRPVTAYTRAATLDANGETDDVKSYAVAFRRGAPGRERELAPGIPNYGQPTILGFAVDNAGNFAAPVTRFSDDQPFMRVSGVLADFSRPRLRPRAFPRRPRARRRVRLNSRAIDSFRRLRSRDVLWRVPRGVRIVRAARRRGRRARGKTIVVRFRRAGRYRIRVTAGDGAGNRRTRFVRIRVRRAR